MRLGWLLLGAAVLGPGSALGVWELSRIGVHQGYSPTQPIAFSHRIHSGVNQVACLYCHSGARKSRHAGIPSPSLCMNCHAILTKQTAEIEKLKEAVQLERPIAWLKVHNLPDFVSFSHSQHVVSGVACQKCHGAVEQMDRVQQMAPLTMGWCLECHRKNAKLPALGIQRAALQIAHGTKPVAGLDCASCHY